MATDVPTFQIIRLKTQETVNFTSAANFNDLFQISFNKFSSEKFKFRLENSSDSVLNFQNGEHILAKERGKMALKNSMVVQLSRTQSNSFIDPILIKFSGFRAKKRPNSQKLDEITDLASPTKKLDLDGKKSEKETFELLENDQVLKYKVNAFDDTLDSRPNDETLKLAFFDMDGTIITPKSGKKFPTDESDWRFLYAKSQIFRKLKEKHDQGFKIIIISNQNGYSQTRPEKAKNRPLLRQKITKIFYDHLWQEAGIPVLGFFCYEKGKFRKPSPGVFDLVLDHLQSTKQKIDLTSSFFCGDAAGRPEIKSLKIKKDFSDSDIKFALNLSLKFTTPDVFFANDKTRKLPTSFDFDPRKYRQKTADQVRPDFDPVSRVVFMCGLPGCGKSTLAQRLAQQDKTYKVVNQDLLKTKEKFNKLYKELLQNPNQKIILDRTNGKPSDRLEFLEMAKKFKATTEIVYLKSSLDRVKHHAAFRSITQGLPEMPPVVFATVKKNFVEPDAGEGFGRITVLEDALFELPDNDLFYNFL